MIKFAVGGIPVSDETLAVEDIAAVGSFGDFLSLDATYRHMREQSSPKLIDRRVREDWQAWAPQACTIVRSSRPAHPRDAPPGASARRRGGGDDAASSQTERDLGVGQIPG